MVAQHAQQEQIGHMLCCIWRDDIVPLIASRSTPKHGLVEARLELRHAKIASLVQVERSARGHGCRSGQHAGIHGYIRRLAVEVTAVTCMPNTLFLRPPYLAARERAVQPLTKCACAVFVWLAHSIGATKRPHPFWVVNSPEACGMTLPPGVLRLAHYSPLSWYWLAW